MFGKIKVGNSDRSPSSSPLSSPSSSLSQHLYPLVLKSLDDIPRVDLLHQFFESQVDKTPYALAIVDGPNELTYIEVEELANQWANIFISYDVHPSDLIAIYLGRSYKTVAIILGILKSGAGLIPIDPSSPMERTKYILKHSKVKLLLSEYSYLEKLPSFSKLIVREEIENHLPFFLNTRPHIPTLSTHDICYIIYTSGTTGCPKGVITEHSNTVHFVNSFAPVLGLTPKDRVYHGFSYAFDGSVEEIWMTFVSGATLIICPDEISKIASEVSAFINKYQVTFFATVPTMLRMISEEMPSLKILEVTGEPCTTDLVNRWARPEKGLRMINVYGPTETCVNATLAECRVGKEITIGKPLPNYDIYILDEKLQRVPFGGEGELYIGNKGVARGYLGREDLTQKQFVRVLELDHESPLYRTGDLVRYNSDGELLFLGRNDSQVKLRGHRIELAEIECFLKSFSPIKQAVVKVVNQTDLASYVILEKGETQLDKLDRDSLLEALKSQFPPYMIPSTLDILDSFPLLASGKVDLKEFPFPKVPLIKVNKIIVAAENELEKKLVTSYCQLFKMSQISTTDDFFSDLGGHSLMAAQAVALLREQLKLEVAIRDIYLYPTIKELASFLLTAAQKATPTPVDERHHLLPPVFFWERQLCFFLQLLTELIIYGLAGLALVGLFYATLLYINGAYNVGTVFKYAIPLILVLHPTMILMTVVAKWVIIGRYKEGVYPLWGLYYYRWWLANKFYALSGIAFFSGTPLLAFYYKMLGAKIGKNVIFDTAFVNSFDLLTVGDNSSLCHETQMLGYRIEAGHLILGNITIEKNCFVGIHSYLGLNVKMEEGSHLGNLSALLDNRTIPRHEFWRGSPAEQGEKSSVANANINENEKRVRHPVRSSIIFFSSLMFMECLSFPMIFLIYNAFVWIYNQWGVVGVILSLYASILPLFIGSALFVVALKWILLPKIKSGRYCIESWFYYRKWLFDGIMRSTTSILRPLYTTLYLPPWLRILGAKIGKGAEISVISQISPDLLEVGEGSFLADSSIIGGRYHYDGYVEIGKTIIGSRSFVGNSAVLPLGQAMGNDSLLGCLSLPPEGENPSPHKTDWLGSPSFRLPNRQKIYGLDNKTLFSPTKALIGERLIIDLARIMLPGILDVTMFIIFFTLIFFLAQNHFSIVGIMALSPFLTMFMTLSGVAMIVLIKKSVMGTFQPVIRPLWCRYVWFNEMINSIYESVFVPMTIPFLGTPFMAPLLRLMGIKIGKNCYVETTFFSEFDLVKIEDNVSLNAGVIIQNHLFEDRVMKSSYLTIKSGVSIGNMSVVLYDTEIREGVCLGPLSLVMKGEKLPHETKWQGIPCS